MDKLHFCKKYCTGIGICDSTCGIRSDGKISRICTSQEQFVLWAPRWKPDEKMQNGNVNRSYIRLVEQSDTKLR